MNFAQMLRKTAYKFQSKPAIVFEGTTYTFSDIDMNVARYASVLKKLGVRTGDRVAFQLDKRIEFIFLHLANLSIGGITLPLNSDYKTDEVDYFLSDSKSAIFVTDAVRFESHRGAVERIGVKTVLVDPQAFDGAACLPELIETVTAEDERDYPTGGDDGAVICYTSGTTGRSKGALITHTNLISNALDLHNIWQWTSEDVLLHVLPLFHVHGLFVALHGALNAGATIIMHGKFSPDRTWQAIEREGCTMMMGVPTIYQRLMNAWDALETKPDLSKMRLFISGSAPLSVNLFARFENETGFRILERYGMTETGMNTSNDYAPEGRKPGSVGFPLPSVSIRVADKDGKDVAPGEVGEIFIKGDNVFKEYWQMPEKTAEAFVDGWFKSGDLGYQDPEDHSRLYLSGRAKELIITGGYNVYPKEIETVLETHDAVRECAVVGLPDEDFGERVTAVLVVKEGTNDSAKIEMISLCRSKLATYKCPKEIHFIDALPRNAMGKIQKNQLVERYTPVKIS